MPVIDSSFTLLVLVATFAYVLGSVPFGLVVSSAFGLGDLRQIGSGNIGATNVLRTGSKPAALATLLLDGGKGAAAVLVARGLAGEDAAQIAGVCAFLGHLFPIWLKFRGGKGLATFLGTLLALAWPVGIAACLTWLLAALLTRMSSLSGLISALAAPIWAIIFAYTGGLAALFLMVGLIFAKHRENIRRIASGTEPKIGKL